MRKDIERAGRFDEAYWWVQEVLGDMRKMWTDKEVQWAMIGWDVRKLRAAERGVEVPPVGWKEGLKEYEEEGEREWVCGWMKKDGTEQH